MKQFGISTLGTWKQLSDRDLVSLWCYETIKAARQTECTEMQQEISEVLVIQHHHSQPSAAH